MIWLEFKVNSWNALVFTIMIIPFEIAWVIVAIWYGK